MYHLNWVQYKWIDLKFLPINWSSENVLFRCNFGWQLDVQSTYYEIEFPHQMLRQMSMFDQLQTNTTLILFSTFIQWDATITLMNINTNNSCLSSQHLMSELYLCIGTYLLSPSKRDSYLREPCQFVTYVYLIMPYWVIWMWLSKVNTYVSYQYVCI